MNDTQKRIEAYRKQLPGLRERVLAVALLLVVSITIGVTTTFAWVVLSRSPEVSGVSTSVASNGNLEIALAPADGSQPGESKVGDSAAAEGQTVVGANRTWGNMINLSDPSYGLDNLVLRPAQLNTADLLGSPLYGAEYGPDGRITKLKSNFDYTAWSTEEQKFEISNSIGVRAISSTKLANATKDEEAATNLLSSAVAHNLGAATTYRALGTNTAYMQSLATMMGLFMTARMNPDEPTLNNPTIDIEDIQNLRDMYAGFLTAFDKEADAIAQLINLGQFYASTGDYKPFTGEDVYNRGNGILKIENETIEKKVYGKVEISTNKDTNADGQTDTIVVLISDFGQFIKDRGVIASDLEKLKTIADSGTSLKWTDSGISGIVNNLVDVGKCTIGSDNTPINSIGASNAMGYLSGTQEARITNGILYRFEERTGGYLEVKGMSISATVKRMGITVPASVKANIQTTAPRDYNLFTNDQTTVEQQKPAQLGSGTYVAEDTFGLAVDFWVRTNAQSHNLVLEGNVLTKSEEVVAMGKDANGNEVELYVLKMPVTDDTGKETTVDLDVYQVKNGEVTTWYMADNHTEIPADEMQGLTPTKKMETVTTVIGYEGANRVWDKDSHTNLNINSTTQGGGSCYVYYADTPEDQARSLKLLESMRVAFVNAEGKLLAEAYMNTEMYYAENGKVIVPLQLDSSKSINLGENLDGETIYGITALEKNKAVRITAIVYLDGTKLTNSEVLAAADIQGKLNIQFGAYADDLNGLENEDLMSKEMSVSASVTDTAFDYDTAEPGSMKTTVKVNVNGTEPKSVTAFFLRQINEQQGSREEKMVFTRQDDGTWTADYTFTVPGVYVLRTVTVDGADFDLEGTPPTVTVTGFAIMSLSCSEAENRHINVLTSASATTANLSLKFATDNQEKMPKKVQGRFLKEEDGSAVNVDFAYNPTTQMWTGTANFLTSGEYTMQYLVLDGEYVELPTSMWHTASIKLGLRVAVYVVMEDPDPNDNSSPTTFKFIPSEMTEDQKNLPMQVTIIDNAGNEVIGLQNVHLYYGMKGSGIKQLHAELTWNGFYYIGTMNTTSPPNGGPGIWQFGNVTVGENVITQSTTSPTFTILSPEPPEYHGQNTATYQYKPNNDAIMNVQITNSAAAAVQAYIIKSGAEGTWVSGTMEGEFTVDNTPVNNWNFAVPKDANGYQDGNWQITQLRLWNVFSADGTAYTEEAPLIIDVADKNIVSKVVCKAYISFTGPTEVTGTYQTKDGVINFGKDENGTVVGAFMQRYDVSGISVTIADFEGMPIDGISDVKLTFTYRNDSKNYGGYTGATNANADFEIPLVSDGSNKVFAQSGTMSMQHAGSWTTTFSFTVSGTTPTTYSGDKLPNGAPKFTVSSVAPTVKITGCSEYKGSGNNSSSSYNSTSATVFPNYTAGSMCSSEAYTAPTVTIELNNMGYASQAKLQFVESNGGDVRIYSDEDTKNQTALYEWTKDGTCSRWIGRYSGSTHMAAGTITANKLVLVGNNVECVFDIGTITITNADK